MLSFTLKTLPHGVHLAEMEGGFCQGRETDELCDRLWDLCSRGRPRLILNFAQIGRIDSVGLGQLIILMGKVKKSHGRLVVLRPSEEVGRVLSQTRLDQVLCICHDQETALHEVRGHGEGRETTPEPDSEVLARETA